MSRAIKKRKLKKLYGINNTMALSDADYREKVAFIRGTMIGSSVECKDWALDVVPFIKRFDPAWKDLFERRKSKFALGIDEWPCYDNDKFEFVVNNKTVEVPASRAYTAL
jgi:hypothetical protein